MKEYTLTYTLDIGKTFKKIKVLAESLTQAYLNAIYSLPFGAEITAYANRKPKRQNVSKNRA